MKKELEEFYKGNIRTLSRFISRAENQDESLYPILAELDAEPHKSQTIGLTGPPGAGKSTLVSEFVKRVRQKNKKVAVIAVDPISPFTGGALLGDRIRLLEHFNDSHVFIRSLSTRGKLGGLSLASREVLRLCTAFGFDYIFIETVGVGQSEVEIRELADLTLVVLTPESGDGIQTLKAGILEIADCFVVNKFDRPGGEALINELKTMVYLSKTPDLPILTTSQQDPPTVDALLETLETLYVTKKELLSERKKQQRRAEYRDLIKRYLTNEVEKTLSKQSEVDNPYLSFLEFKQKYPSGSLLRREKD